MRMGTLVLFCLLVPVIALATQQDVPKPKKVLTPEQQKYQLELKTVRDESNRLRSKAKRAFDAEMERGKKDARPDAKSTLQINVCLDHEKKTTEGNYRAYTEAIRATLGLKEPGFPGIEPPQRGPSGPILTPEQLVDEFDKTERLWESYRDSQCTAAFHQFGGGTAAPASQMECEQRLIRGHMRDLDSVYGLMLHN